MLTEDGVVVPDPRTLHESEPAMDDKFIVQQFIWPVAIDDPRAAGHEDVRREWAALLEQAASASARRDEVLAVRLSQ